MDSSAQAPAPAHNAVNAENVEDAAPPVQAEARNHGGGHQAQNSDNHHHGEHFHAKVAQRQSYLSSLAASRDALNSHFLERRSSSLDLDRYFVGPRDLDKHSKWPIFLRLHGSVLPKMIVPITFVACWSTVITCISVFVHNLGIQNILLTVLGFVVGLALSFRSSTAYERYAEGRKYWALLLQTSRNLARTIWVSISEREGEEGKEDLLAKLTAMNLILAFAVALKHKLRFEPDIAYDDLVGLVGYLDTFAKEAHDPDAVHPPRKSTWKAVGEHLGLPFAASNPRKLIKRAKKPLGNLPLEILNYLTAYIDLCVANGTLKSTLHQGQVIGALASLNEVLTGTERVLHTPLPVAYTIAISQIAWVYVLVLPFQLFNSLGWITIPGSIVAAYIILGLAAIGDEIENPFGHDVNDLPLDKYCKQLASELEVITASPPPDAREFITRSDNLVLYPLSLRGYSEWKARSVEEIRAALRSKVIVNTLAGTSKSSTIVLDEDGKGRRETNYNNNKQETV
ncbi:Bestrophin, RFP-TM, chloride channel-domain-containing protein [Thermoascus aurantiacus ATCC 26904]